MATPEIDAVSRTATTGHQWDGIRELNTPLPRWWLWTFYATIAWAFVYWILFPAWPLVGGYTAGVLGYSSRTQVAAELAELRRLRGEKGAALQQASLAAIEADPALLAFAQAQGRAAFANNCAPCHGAGAAGATGYPESQRRRLAVGRFARCDLEDDRLRGAIRPPGGARKPDAGFRQDRPAQTGRDRCGGELCALAVRPAGPSRRRFGGRSETVRGQLRELPRRRRQGQTGARRAKPGRPHLALRFRRGQRSWRTSPTAAAV